MKEAPAKLPREWRYLIGFDNSQILMCQLLIQYQAQNDLARILSLNHSHYRNENILSYFVSLRKYLFEI